MFLLLWISRNILLLVFSLNIRWISLYSFYFLFPSYLHQFSSNLKLNFIQEYFRYYTDQINILKKQKVSRFTTFELIITSKLKKLIKCTFFYFQGVPAFVKLTTLVYSSLMYRKVHFSNIQWEPENCGLVRRH